jgi:hypothetical protein
MKSVFFAIFVLGSMSAFASADLVNCASVLEARKIPACTELVSPSDAGRPADVKKGQRWSDEFQISDAADTYVLKGRGDICVDKFTDKATKAGVCGG